MSSDLSQDALRVGIGKKLHSGLVGDGIARVYGLNEIQAGKWLNLPRRRSCQALGSIVDVPAGKAMLGRVVDALGVPIDGRGALSDHAKTCRESPRGLLNRLDVNAQRGTISSNSFEANALEYSILVAATASDPAPLQFRPHIRFKTGIGTISQVAALAQFGSDLDLATRALLNRGLWLVFPFISTFQHTMLYASDCYASGPGSIGSSICTFIRTCIWIFIFNLGIPYEIFFQKSPRICCPYLFMVQDPVMEQEWAMPPPMLLVFKPKHLHFSLFFNDNRRELRAGKASILMKLRGNGGRECWAYPQKERL
ncbi:hypothetical protein Patl1_23046 [Pistacia atlantica]|uniref:Uncharacterized protein n=1 Tax=Pistacia atlantica TaxID=434234 RepID=A0ACC0ZZX4_9ROSI|nr:hypothetical protein Patl1_23046 [Pistacia atlantica]